MAADIDVLIVGAGHAGLGVAARLKARGREPIILEANARVGDSWRERWASLRLFTPRFMNALPGIAFPAGADPFPGKDEVADYQESYATENRLDVRTGVRVERIRPSTDGFEATFGGQCVLARSVIVANGAHQVARVPAFAARLDGRVAQLHSRDYGRAGALPPGPVLIVGARNSGLEIAMDLASEHQITIAVGSTASPAPARWRDPRWWRVAQFRNRLFHGWEPPGPWPWPVRPAAGRWIEVDLARLERDGLVRTAARAIDAEGDVVRLADGREIKPRTVVWATGFRVDDSWIDAPSRENGIVVGRHRRGPVAGLWILRAGLLPSVYWGGYAVAADITRR
jgi:putative flavoprotein involved in K+ transport